jgi:phosphohistidine phosphatase
MPTLILMRHAQAEPAAIDGADHERPLSDTGRREALRAAQQLRAMTSLPDRVLISPSLRTRQTADIVCGALGLDSGVCSIVDALYLATPSPLRAAIAANAAASACLLVIGHNPGISELARRLQRESDGFSLPTGGLCRIDVADSGWNALRTG